MKVHGPPRQDRERVFGVVDVEPVRDLQQAGARVGRHFGNRRLLLVGGCSARQTEAGRQCDRKGDRNSGQRLSQPARRARHGVAGGGVAGAAAGAGSAAAP